MKNTAIQITVAAELWDVYAKSNSCSNASEQKGNKPVSVNTFQSGSFYYTSFGTVYGQYGIARNSAIYAYKLLPLEMYAGETTLIYHDADAIHAGTRKRGDSTGLIVSASGKLLVCVERVDFIKGLPGTRPLTLAEAKDFNQKAAAYGGWRALWYIDGSLRWYSLQGHPVASYETDLGSRYSVLLWQKQKGEIYEMSISEEIELSSIESDIGVMCTQTTGQLCMAF